MNKFNKRILITGALTLTVGLVIYGSIKSFSNDTKNLANVEYHTVKNSSLNISVTEGGTLSAVDKIIVKNELSGNSKIIKIVAEGTYVKAGDIIVELDAAETKERKKKLELEVENSKTALESAKNSYIIEQSTIESEVRAATKSITFTVMDLQRFNELDKKQQLRNAETDITTAEDSFKLSEQRYNWSQKLAAKGFETKSQVDRDRLDMNGKVKSLETAKNRLAMLSKFDLPKEEAELKSKLTEAKKKHERVKKQGESKLVKAKASLESAKRKLKLNLERLEDLNLKLTQVKLKAPVDGLVLYPTMRRYSHRDPIEEGVIVSKNRKLLTIPNLSKMEVKLKIPEFHIAKMKKGLKAFITVDSLPDKRFSGIVTKVSVLPNKESSWLSTGDKFYTVMVLITDKLPGIKPSVSAKVEIQVANWESVISVPLQAVKTIKGKHYCYIKSTSEPKQTAVELGQANDHFVHIKDGLKEGDEVLLSAPFDK